jgi:hypothetical protein
MAENKKGWKSTAESASGTNVEPISSSVVRTRREDLCNETHYSVAELAALWNFSRQTIRRMFEKEPGVLVWRNEETRSKRVYTTLSIPESVALRVHRRLRIAG